MQFVIHVCAACCRGRRLGFPFSISKLMNKSPNLLSKQFFFSCLQSYNHSNLPKQGLQIPHVPEHIIISVLPSVSCWKRFYQEFRASGQPNLAKFYRSYVPPITPEHYTCVGLALELLCRLANLEPRFPGITSCLYLVSSEESIEELEEYVNGEPNPRTTEKEHVMVAMQLNIAGRHGVMLLDPGYHVARVITVMADGLYPHTGWFVQSDEPHCRKEYNYTLTGDGKYVVWCNRETRNNLEENSLALIYVARPFLSPIEVTERRNLVYNFRSLLARDTKGHLIAGFYLKVECSNQPAVTIFHQNGNSTKRKKMTFEELLKPDATEEVQSIVHICSQQLGMPEEHLQIMLANLSIILADSDFISQLLGINRDIYEMSCNN